MMYSNDVIKYVLSRRSIRKYKQMQVPEDYLRLILDTSLYAPSALNYQPWQIRVIQDRSLLDRINQNFINWAKGKNLPGSASRAAEPGFSVFHNAPALIVVASDTNNHYADGDCGMLTQNILLVAHSLGLGTCVLGNVATAINCDLPLKTEVLQISDSYNVMFGIAIGYPDEKPEPKARDENKIKWIR